MQTSLDQCPLCGSELSQTKFREIRAKLRSQEERSAAELAEAKVAITRNVEQELKRQFEQEKQAAEKKLKAETEQLIKKATAEHQVMAKKLEDAEAREVEIRKQAQSQIEMHKQKAEKKAKADAELEMKKIATERDLATKKLKESEEREAQVRKQVADQAEQERQKQLLEQRQAMEKDKKLSLLKQQAEHNRDRDSLLKKVKMLEHQVEKKTANELGDGGEINVFEALRDAFQGDRITRIQKGQQGADILHEILYKGDVCGRIVVDSKNRQAWQNTFVSKLREDKLGAKAEHAILATTVFPAGKKELCIESGIIVVSTGLVVYITELLRQAMISMHVKGLSLNERSNKMSQLYSLITSERYSKKFVELETLATDILDLDVKEQQEHSIVWRKRGTIATRIKNALREVGSEVAAVIEGGDMRGAESQELAPIKVARVAL